jgi:hypothetical protein
MATQPSTSLCAADMRENPTKSDGQRPAGYMNYQHLDFFRQRLLALKDEMTRNAHGSRR